MGSKANVWGINPANEIFRYTGNDASPWVQVAGYLSDIGVAADGTVWGISPTNEIFRYSGNGSRPWVRISGALSRISVGSKANVWGVNDKNEIFRYTGDDASPWSRISDAGIGSGGLSGIAVAADGTVFGINPNNDVFWYVGEVGVVDVWVPFPGTLSQISVGSKSNMWGVNAAYEIYQSTDYAPVPWAQVPGGMSEVGVGADGTVWGVNPAYEIFRADFAPAGYAAPPRFLGGNRQYVFAGDVPLKDLVVEIKVTEAIQVSPTSGVSSTVLHALPIGFQINGFSPGSNQTVGWQQFGVKMWPNLAKLQAFAETWPTAYETNRKLVNLFSISSLSYNGTYATLPNDLTIPAGWTIRVEFQQQSDGTISGFACTVTDRTENMVNSPLGMGIDLLNNVKLAAGGFVGQGDLAQIVAFNVVLVGFWSEAQAVLVSGAGTIKCTSSTPMTPITYWPWPTNDPGGFAAGSGNFGTAENTNSSYGLVRAGPSTSIVQTFATYT